MHQPDTPPVITADDEDAPLSADARNAMRAYLQRTEVRLSTLHRIAVAFIGGAGLLLLLPTFFKEEVTVLIRIILHSLLADAGGMVRNPLPHMLLYAAVLYPFVLSLAIPLYALYTLLKDVVHFYFTIYTPGFPERLITPSFALSGVGFSPDESPEAKRRVLAYQYRQASAINFAIPFSPEKRRAYFDQIIESTGGDILPPTRRYEAIAAMDVLNKQTDRATVDHFGAAFGLARTLDRRLVEEVATSEIALVRHIIYLRRMMLRYIKALLMFIWTTLVTFIMLPFLQTDAFPNMPVLVVGYFIWSLLVVPIMRIPLTWIYRHRHAMPETGQIDTQLVIPEKHMQRWLTTALIVSSLGVLLALWLYR
jgi:hypothetical protein